MSYYYPIIREMLINDKEEHPYTVYSEDYPEFIYPLEANSIKEVMAHYKINGNPMLTAFTCENKTQLFVYFWPISETTTEKKWLSIAEYQFVPDGYNWQITIDLNGNQTFHKQKEENG